MKLWEYKLLSTYGSQAVHPIRPVGSVAYGIRVEGVVVGPPSVPVSRHLRQKLSLYMFCIKQR